MGFSKKTHADTGMESETKKWVIAGISVRSLKPINTKPRGKENEDDSGDDNEARSTTPTEKEARIPEKLPCPPAPRKPRVSRCHHFNGVTEFFTPPDLATVFKRRV